MRYAMVIIGLAALIAPHRRMNRGRLTEIVLRRVARMDESAMQVFVSDANKTPITLRAIRAGAWRATPGSGWFQTSGVPPLAPHRVGDEYLPAPIRGMSNG